MSIITTNLRWALRETFEVCSLLVPPDQRPGFVLVGGAALERHGRDRRTLDVDIAATPEAHWEFQRAAEVDPRFSFWADGKRIPDRWMG